MFNAYLINLDRNPERLNKFKNKNKDKIPGDIVRVSAIDGKALPKSFATACYEEGFVNHGIALKGDYWLQGTTGCFLSHIKAWEMFLDSNEEYALILEDDAKVNLRLDNSYEYVKNNELDFTFIHGRYTVLNKDLIEPVSGIAICEINDIVGTGGEGYYISRKCALALTAFFKSYGFKDLPAGFDSFAQSLYLKSNNLNNKPGVKSIKSWYALHGFKFNVAVSDFDYVLHDDEGYSAIHQA